MQQETALSSAKLKAWHLRQIIPQNLRQTIPHATLKGFRRIFSRFEKLDVLFLGFLNFAVVFPLPVENGHQWSVLFLYL
jgi:hypothetical protein